MSIDSCQKSKLVTSVAMCEGPRRRQRDKSGASPGSQQPPEDVRGGAGCRRFQQDSNPPHSLPPREPETRYLWREAQHMRGLGPPPVGDGGIGTSLLPTVGHGICSHIVRSLNSTHGVSIGPAPATPRLGPHGLWAGTGRTHVGATAEGAPRAPCTLAKRT